MESECLFYTGETNLDCNPKTQLHSPVKNQDSVDCLSSRGRRLFPQRRTSIPNFMNRKIDAKLCFPAFEPLPLDDVSPTVHQGFDSSASSPSSAGSGATVNIRKSPTFNRPFLETDGSFREDGCGRIPCVPGVLPISCSAGPEIALQKSSNTSIGSDFSANLYTNAPTGGNLRWKSMAEFHKARHRLNLRILSHLPNGEQASCNSDDHHDPLVPKHDGFEGISPFKPGLCQWKQSPKPTAHPGLSPIEVGQDSDQEEDTYMVTKGHSSLDAAALEIGTWDCTVKMSSVATVARDGKLHVHHLALLSVIMPMEALYAEKVSLSLMVSNAFRTNHKCSLELGQSSLLFKEDFSQPHVFPREGAEMIIVRDSCDLEKPFNLYFAFTYSFPWQFVMASLPTFWPKKGRLLSDVVFIAEPQPPLSVRTYIRHPLSSWRLCHHPASQVTCYERINLPRLYHAGLQDDIEMKYWELDPVHFRALGDSTLSRVVWKLDIAVHELTRGQIECQMSFFVDVGVATALVSLIPHGWVPRYFIINGCVATEKAGECWKSKEGHIMIFKQPHMGPGPIMVETYWQGPPKDGNRNVGSTCNLSLPMVADRKVLGGRLTCLANESKYLWQRTPMVLVNVSIVILLNHLGEKIRPYGPVDENCTLLPTMGTGYTILLKRFTESRSQNSRPTAVVRRPFLPIPEDTHLSENSVILTDAKVKKARKDHGTGLSHDANNARRAAAPPKHLLQPLLLSLFVLLLLVPGFLLFVKHIRKESNHNKCTSSRDRDPSSRDGERHQAIIDVAGSEPLQPDVVVEDGPADVAKCEGWRDWVDYGSGWKGCIP